MIIKLNLPKIQRVFKKNLEFFFLLLAIIITIFSVRIYNVNKNVINQNYINLINNTYFQKSINHVFNNLKPKFIDSEDTLGNKINKKIIGIQIAPLNEEIE